MIRELVKNQKFRLNPNVKGLNQLTAIERAAENGDLEMFTALVDVGAELNNLILHAAAKFGQVSNPQDTST